MTTIAGLMLCAALLPLLTAAITKAGGKAFDNRNPRAWLASQDGWRARGDAAQQNQFEGLPFFFAAVLFAVYNDADVTRLALLMCAWLILKIAYIGLYLADRASIRSLAWGLALAINIAILFTHGPI